MLVDSVAEQWLRQHPCPDVLRLDSSGHPPQVFERVGILDNGVWLPVNWPSDLKGKVTIRSQDDALAFVRLFSSADTWYCFPEFGYIEARITEGGLPRAGDMSRDTFREWCLQEPEVLSRDGVYRVRRSVIQVLDFDAVAAATIDETVTPDGGYSLRVLCKRRLRGQQASNVFVPNPQ